MNFIRKTRSRKKLILCTDLRADQTFKMARTDERMMAAFSIELVAKNVCYHRTCYQSLTRDFLSNRNTEQQRVDESSTFEKMTVYLANLVENPDIAKY